MTLKNFSPLAQGNKRFLRVECPKKLGNLKESFSVTYNGGFSPVIFRIIRKWHSEPSFQERFSVLKKFSYEILRRTRKWLGTFPSPFSESAKKNLDQFEVQSVFSTILNCLVKPENDVLSKIFYWIRQRNSKI